MNRLGGIGNSNATSVIGDKNTYMATSTPNLNALTAQNDAYVGITSSSGDFGVYNKLVLDTSIVETFDFEFYPTSTSASLDQIVFQGALPNWVKSEEIYLSFPVTIACSSLQAKNYLMDPLFYLDSSYGLWASVLSSYGTNSKNYNITDHLLFPDFALLNLFKRVQVYLGNNSQPMGRSSVNQTAGIKLNACDTKFDNSKISEYGLWGTPYSILDYSAVFSTDYTYYSVPALDMNAYEKQWACAFKQTLASCSRLHDNITDPIAQAESSIDKRWKDSYLYTKDINLPIRLSMLNSFFKGDKMLPPDLKFKIDFQINKDWFNIAATSPQQKKAAPAEGWAMGALFGCKIRGAPKMVIRGHSIKQDIQLSINTKWQTFPFLYNYETYEPYEIYGNGSSNPYITTIAISQQRPTELFIRFLDTTTTFIDPAKFNTITEKQAFTFFGNITYADSLCSQNYPQTFTIDSASLTTKQVFSKVKWTIMDIKIKFQGRLIYWTRHPDINDANGIPNEYDRLNDKYRTQSYLKYDELKYSNDTFNVTNKASGGTSIDMIIAPGGKVDTGFLPADQGAQHIIIEITTATPIPADKKIVIWKKLPEQVSIDINKNANLIMWPAIKSNEATTQIASTVNTQ